MFLERCLSVVPVDCSIFVKGPDQSVVQFGGGLSVSMLGVSGITWLQCICVKAGQGWSNLEYCMSRSVFPNLFCHVYPLNVFIVP